MKSLRMLRNMNFDKIMLSHTKTLNSNDIVVEANRKIDDYIKYREERERFLIENLKVI